MSGASSGAKSGRKLAHGILALAVAICSGAGLLPAVRRTAVHLVERQYAHRALNMDYWSKQLFALSFLAFAVNLLAYLALETGRGRRLARSLRDEILTQARLLRADRKPVLVLFALYAFGMLSIFRANYYYGGADDLYRAMSGARAWRNFYRYVSHFLSVLVHTSPKLFDIAPLSQLLALLVMAVSAVALVRVFPPRREAGADETFSPLVYLAAIPVCLFPYFLENLSYRYDAPYMALSVFFCIVPFLFSGRLGSFAAVSVMGLFLMCLSYQASSGVYIVVCAFLVFKMWAGKERNARELTAFVLTAIVCYALTLAVFFALFNVQPNGDSYVDKNVRTAFLPNARAYLTQVWDDFGWSALKAASLLIAGLFVALSCRKSRRRKIPTFLVALLLLAFCAVFSYGAFLVMGHPLLEPRSMFPFGSIISLSALHVALWLVRTEDGGGRPGPLPALGKLTICVLAYSSIAFAFAYGNAQHSQNRYTEFRMTLLLEDLSRIVPEEQDDIHIHILSDIDDTLIVKNLAHSYPLVTRMLERLGGHAVIFYLEEFGFGVQAETDRYTEWDKNLDGYTLCADTRYHYIWANGNVYYVYFKTPAITLRE